MGKSHFRIRTAGSVWFDVGLRAIPRVRFCSFCFYSAGPQPQRTVPLKVDTRDLVYLVKSEYELRPYCENRINFEIGSS